MQFLDEPGRRTIRRKRRGDRDQAEEAQGVAPQPDKEDAEHRDDNEQCVEQKMGDLCQPSLKRRHFRRKRRRAVHQAQADTQHDQPVKQQAERNMEPPDEIAVGVSAREQILGIGQAVKADNQQEYRPMDSLLGAGIGRVHDESQMFWGLNSQEFAGVMPVGVSSTTASMPSFCNPATVT